jgi:hypothetical protein
MTRKLIFTLLATFTALAFAQTPIYESKDKAGPVFSDQPSPGAKVVDPPSPNVIDTARPAPPQPATSGAPAQRYTSLAVVSPARGGTLHSNTGALELRVRLSPGLRSGQGDRLRVKLDGTELPGRFRSDTIQITEADWQRAANPAVAEHTLQAAVVDGSGNVLIESPVSLFFVHRATVRQAR